jgi:hypothetical protein
MKLLALNGSPRKGWHTAKGFGKDYSVSVHFYDELPGGFYGSGGLQNYPWT